MDNMKPEKPNPEKEKDEFEKEASELIKMELKLAEKDKEIEMLKIGAKHMEDEIASLKSDKEYFINQNRLNSLEVIRLKKELDSRRTA